MKKIVYPACAGIHLRQEAKERIIECLPRMRGDPPEFDFWAGARDRSTPHARGSTLESTMSTEGEDVYPACAGIHRSS